MPCLYLPTNLIVILSGKVLHDKKLLVFLFFAVIASPDRHHQLQIRLVGGMAQGMRTGPSSREGGWATFSRQI